MKRSWIVWAVLLAIFVAVLIINLPELERVVGRIAEAQWQWLLVATLPLIARYLVDAALFQASFTIVGVESQVRELVPVVFASLFVNLAGITASGALFVDDAARRGQSPARATAGVLLVLLADYAAFILFLAVATTYLALQGALQLYQIFGVAFLVSFIIVLITPLFLGLRRRARLRQVLEWVQNAVNRQASRFGRRPPLGEDWASENVASFTAAAVSAASHPRQFIRLLAVAAGFHACGLLGMLALFAAFRQPIGPVALETGYALGILFWIIGITPQGIGVVESAMALTYISIGVPIAAAVAIGLVFRGLGFWLPLTIGLLFLPRVRLLRRKG